MQENASGKGQRHSANNRASGSRSAISMSAAFWQQACKGVLDGKRQRISIPERYLARIRIRPARRKACLQTLINSILYKYVKGRGGL